MVTLSLVLLLFIIITVLICIELKDQKAKKQEEERSEKDLILKNHLVMYCKKCGNELPEGATFCKNCGTGTNKAIKHCPYCKGELQPGAVICTHCGRSLDTINKNEDKTNFIYAIASIVCSLFAFLSLALQDLYFVVARFFFFAEHSHSVNTVYYTGFSWLIFLFLCIYSFNLKNKIQEPMDKNTQVLARIAYIMALGTAIIGAMLFIFVTFTTCSDNISRL